MAGPCSATCGRGVRAVVWVCGDTRADTYHKVGVGTARESCYKGFLCVATINPHMSIND